jgi:galacturan 1,4-alpha-galacturonidase
MPQFIKALGLFFATSALVSASPMPTAAPDLNNAAELQKRASCTFAGASGAAAAIKSKASCASKISIF